MWRFLQGLTTPLNSHDGRAESSTTTTSSSGKTFRLGINLLHCPEDSAVEYISPLLELACRRLIVSRASIVFVHGLTGDCDGTWAAQGAFEPWPKALLPSELPTARILTFGYDAHVTSMRGMVSKNRIGEHAGKLLESLASYRDDDNTVGTGDTDDRTVLTWVERPSDHIRMS